MAYRRKSKARHNGNSSFSLNITSMTDMFTILLVFLLQTYSTSEVEITPENGMSLPVSNSELNPTRAIKLTLSNTELKLEGRKIASIENHGFVKTDLDSNDSHFIKPLFEELEKLNKESENLIASATPAAEAAPKSGFGSKPLGSTAAELMKIANQEGRIMLIAESTMPYETLRKVMYTASMAGFPKLKMATVSGN